MVKYIEYNKSIKDAIKLCFDSQDEDIYKKNLISLFKLYKF